MYVRNIFEFERNIIYIKPEGKSARDIFIICVYLSNI